MPVRAIFVTDILAPDAATYNAAPVRAVSRIVAQAMVEYDAKDESHLADILAAACPALSEAVVQQEGRLIHA